MSRCPSAPGCTVEEDGHVTFTHQAAAARDVRVAGDFTRWADGAIPLARVEGTDRWSARVAVPRGAHAYKYIVDGAWIADPGNRLARADGYGGRNSAFVAGSPVFGSDGAIRIASLNLHTYQEPEPLDVLERIALAMVAMDVDLLLLQEVAQHVSDPARPNAGDVVRDHLAALTGRPWHHAWFEAHIGFDVYREGESVISSAPLAEVTEVRLGEGFRMDDGIQTTAYCRISHQFASPLLRNGGITSPNPPRWGLCPQDPRGGGISSTTPRWGSDSRIPVGATRV